MSAAAVPSPRPRPVFQLVPSSRRQPIPELRVADARLAGVEAALAGGDLALAQRLVRQALDDLAAVSR